MIIGICDDFTPDAERLRDMLESCLNRAEFDLQIRIFNSSESLLNQFRPNFFHILFLDIYMPGLNGVQCAETIRESDSNCELVFTTSSPDHAMESYGVHAAGYLLKPYSDHQLAEVLEWCLAKLSAQLKTLEIISDREKMKIPMRDILYIEVYGRTSIIHTAERQIPTNRSLNELIKKLGDSFLQCHRSYVVNMEHVVKPIDASFLLPGGKSVPITVDNKNRIKKNYFEWSFRRVWESR